MYCFRAIFRYTSEPNSATQIRSFLDQLSVPPKPAKPQVFMRVMPPAIEIGTTMGGNQSWKAAFPGGNVGITGEHEVFSIFPKMKNMFGKKNKKQNVFKNPEISPNVFPLVFPKNKNKQSSDAWYTSLSLPHLVGAPPGKNNHKQPQGREGLGLWWGKKNDTHKNLWEKKVV